MERDNFNDHFIRFPYRKDKREDGGVNNGGIDLINQPQRIDEIHELEGAPWLKRLLIEANSPDGHFMTFGCDYGPLDSYYAGYVDFSFRPKRRPDSVEELRRLDTLFYDWLSDLYSDDTSELSQMDFSRAMLQWSYSPVEYQGTFDKVSLWYRAQAPDGCKWLIDHVRHFLVETYPSLPHVKNSIKTMD